jgi:arsenate reductase
MNETVTLGFVCVQNAGRSQMASAFAEAEREQRGLEETVNIVTGGTSPAEAVHEVVVRVMDEVGHDLSDRTPQTISDEELAACDIVATMGCSTLDIDTETDVRDWALEDPDGAGIDGARRIRETVRRNVEALFDDIEDSAE